MRHYLAMPILLVVCLASPGVATDLPTTTRPISPTSVPKTDAHERGDAVSKSDKGAPGLAGNSVDHSDTSLSAAWITFLAALAAASVTAIANIWYFRRQLRQTEREREIGRLRALLDGFYGPFVTLKKANRNLHDILKTKVGEDGNLQKEEWRTLDLLLQGHEFEDNERAMIELILDINGELDSLIGKHCGVIENDELQTKVHDFRTHIRLIRYAFEGRISGQPERFHAFVYPTGLDELFEEEAAALRKRLKNLCVCASQ